MIRINLAKTPGKKGKEGGSKSGARIGPVYIVLLILALAGGGAYYYITYVKPGAVTAESVESAVSAVSGAVSEAVTGVIAALPEKREPDPVPPAPLPPPVPKDEAHAKKPSTLVRTNMAEDVVKEIDTDVRPVNKLETPYAEMAAGEKVNYEVLFARNVFDMVTRCTPPGIRLKALDVDNFQTVYVSGAGLSRQMVQEMFTAYRNERGELMPKPQSYIKDDEGSHFIFAITYKPRYGMDVSDPFQALDRIGFKESLTDHMRSVTRLADVSGFKITSAPAQASAERDGNYRHVVYKAAGTSTYRDFHKFVLALYDEKVPCAFKKVKMTPVKDEVVHVDVEILFTVKE